MTTKPDWQPIETAPKDGTHILLTDGLNVCQCYWRERGGDTDWLDDSGWYMMHRQRFSGPTHWMPLPSPPQEQVEPSGERCKHEAPVGCGPKAICSLCDAVLEWEDDGVYGQWIEARSNVGKAARDGRDNSELAGLNRSIIPVREPSPSPSVEGRDIVGYRTFVNDEGLLESKEITADEFYKPASKEAVDVEDSDLVRRLKAIRDNDWRISMLAYTSDTAGEATAEISKLAQELAVALDDRDIAQAESARLREALETIAIPTEGSGRDLVKFLTSTARTALEQVEPSEERRTCPTCGLNLDAHKASELHSHMDTCTPTPVEPTDIDAGEREDSKCPTCGYRYGYHKTDCPEVLEVESAEPSPSSSVEGLDVEGLVTELRDYALNATGTGTAVDECLRAAEALKRLEQERDVLRAQLEQRNAYIKDLVSECDARAALYPTPSSKRK